MKISLLIHPEELNVKWISKAAKTGADVLALHPRGGVDADKTLEDMLSSLERDDFRALIDRAISSGLEVEYEFHSASYLVPRELFGEHPEYFRENENGERVPDFNFCPSSEEALDIAAKRAVGLSKRLYRNSHNYYFWLDDVKGKQCHCEKCRKLTQSDQAMIICNRIIKELRSEDKEARLSYLAYEDTLTPPSSVRPEAGIFFEFAPIKRDFSKPVSCCTQQYFENIRRLFECFGRGNGRVLEYWFDNSLFSSWKKPPKRFLPDNEMIANDFKTYKELGFDDIASFACFLGEDYDELYGDADISAVRMAKQIP